MSRVVPGAEPFSFHGGPIGILLLHGFTGNPAALRRIGEWLAARGHTVSCPRYPGHGTAWKELGRTRWQDWVSEATRGLKEIDRRCETVILLGLSAGGSMALHLAARYPDIVRGLVLVNPYLRDRRIRAAMYLWGVIPPRKGIGDDIKKPGETELPYEKIPVRALGQLARFLRIVERELPRIRQPLLVFNSPEDHVVPKGNAEHVLERVESQEKELIVLPNSYHVATLDHDAELIFERTHEFAEAHARSDHGEEPLDEEEAAEPADERAGAGAVPTEPQPAEAAGSGGAEPPEDEAPETPAEETPPAEQASARMVDPSELEGDEDRDAAGLEPEESPEQDAGRSEP
jgi:carboxylesterase